MKKGEDKLIWSVVKCVLCMDLCFILLVVVFVVFWMDVVKLLVYIGVELLGIGYVLFKLSKVDVGDKFDDVSKKVMLE